MNSPEDDSPQGIGDRSAETSSYGKTEEGGFEPPVPLRVQWFSRRIRAVSPDNPLLLKPTN